VRRVQKTMEEKGYRFLMGRYDFESAKRRLGNGAVLALIRTIIMFPRGGVWHRV
jgi:hypothetical protein